MIKNCLFVLLLTVAISGCGKKTAAKSGEATLEELNQVLSVMSMGASHAPTNVNQLTNFPTLRGKTLPQPPPGKKLVIDPSTRTVVFLSE